MKKGNLKREQLIELCRKYGNKYISKEGEEYVKALSKIFKIVNRNDRPFLKSDIKMQPTIKDFNFSGLHDFKFICFLRAKPMMLDSNGNRIENEKIIAYNFVSPNAETIFFTSLGVAYLITCIIDGDEHIIKFGQSRTTFSNRLGSYNCGTVNNWRTASTTNIKMLQSLVSTNIEFRLYLRESNDFRKYLINSNEPFETFNWAGNVSVPFASPFSLAVEDICVKNFIKKYGHPPIANVQANATEVKSKKEKNKK